MIELRIRRAIGAILDKRQWSVKWCEDSIRDKWLNEIEACFIAETVRSDTPEWKDSRFERAVLSKYDAFPKTGTTMERRKFLRCPKVKYEMIWDEAPLVKRTPEEFKEANARMQLYHQLVWYFELAELTARMSKISLRKWKLGLHFTLGISKTVYRTAQFLVGVRSGSIKKEKFASFEPSGDHRPEIVEAVWFHVDRIMRELDSIRCCIIKTLDAIASHSIVPGCVQETWISDKLISCDLKHKFIDEVTVLENVPEDEKDWHPYSGKQVLDLVHPSLYCIVFGTTKCVSDVPLDERVVRMQRIAFMADKLVTDPYTTTSYQWIPSDFLVTDSGEVQIQSYTNNLHPVQHQAMYDSIGSIFKAFVPMFERVLSSLQMPLGPDPVMDVDVNNRETAIPHHPPIPDKLEFPSTRFELRGRVVQVIVKIAEIHLTTPAYPGGAWHLEGSDAEQLVATGIYYFGCENIMNSTLGFRVIVNEPAYMQDDNLGMHVAYGLRRGGSLVQPLGRISTVEDRCIVFPNTLQHRVSPFELEDESKPGVRKILAFFLVDPTKRIPSTSVIPPQQKEWIQDLQDSATSVLPSHLPDVVIQK